jgi:large subunit ribosomal protein L32
MGPLPKRKTSKSRRNRRRAHDSLSLPHLVLDSDTGEYRLAHHATKKQGCTRASKSLNRKRINRALSVRM